MEAGGLIGRVTEVLTRSGLSKKEFADRIGIDGSKLAKSLADRRRFTSLELALIAELDGTTVDWLLTGDATREIVFAHRAAEHAVEAGDLVGREAIEQLVERAEGLTFLGRELPAPDLPRPPSGRGWLKQANTLASRYLEAFGGPVGGMSNTELIGRIEDRFGIDVVVTDLPDSCDGLSFSDGGARAIILATTEAPFRQRFTLAHELAHVAFGDSHDEVIEERLYATKTTTEKRANTFAATFLASRSEILDVCGARSPVDAFDELVLHFQLSPDSMSWRLFNEEMIDAPTQRRLAGTTARSIAMRAGRAAEHTDRARLAQHARPAQRLVDAYLEAYRDGLTTLRPAASLLGMSVDQLAAYFVESASEDDVAAFEVDD